MMTIQQKIEYLRDYDGRPLRLMEVCGTHTAGIFKSGIRSLISPKIRLISGPGCPVCVTPTAYIDKCVEYALTPGFALVSFGDMLKVPGARSFASFSSLSEQHAAPVPAAPEINTASEDAAVPAAPGSAASVPISPEINTASEGTAVPAASGTVIVESAAQETVSLERAKGFGARVELVYSPFDVIAMAEREPDTIFVIAAVGFETTAPAYALLMDELVARHMTNVMFLTALKSAIPAIEWVCENARRSEDNGEGADGEARDETGGINEAGADDASRDDIDGFLCPGHVSVITGSDVYAPLAEKYGKPFVVAGFEEAHLVNAIYELVRLARGSNGASGCGSRNGGNGSADSERPKEDQESGYNDASPTGHEQTAKRFVVNRYTETVTVQGNVKARKIIDKYFDHGAAVWRGLGAIAGSGFYLRSPYIEFDAGSRSLTKDASLPEGCRCADVITGRIDPPDCPMFGQSCTPESARGPCMVSAEGACGIWHANV